jgi:hypothetical protein
VLNIQGIVSRILALDARCLTTRESVKFLTFQYGQTNPRPLARNCKMSRSGLVDKLLLASVRFQYL